MPHWILVGLIQNIIQINIKFRSLTLTKQSCSPRTNITSNHSNIKSKVYTSITSLQKENTNGERNMCKITDICV